MDSLEILLEKGQYLLSIESISKSYLKLILKRLNGFVGSQLKVKFYSVPAVVLIHQLVTPALSNKSCKVMYKAFVKFLKKRRPDLDLSDEQILLAQTILEWFEHLHPEMLAARTGKTMMFKLIDEFLDTKPQLDAETIRPRKRKA